MLAACMPLCVRVGERFCTRGRVRVYACEDGGGMVRCACVRACVCVCLSRSRLDFLADAPPLTRANIVYCGCTQTGMSGERTLGWRRTH